MIFMKNGNKNRTFSMKNSARMLLIFNQLFTTIKTKPKTLQFLTKH